MKALTEKQAEYLQYLMDFIESAGYPPTFREMGAHFDVTPGTISDKLLYIEKKGYIARDGNAGSRAITILTDCEGDPVKLKFVKKEGEHNA